MLCFLHTKVGIFHFVFLFSNTAADIDSHNPVTLKHVKPEMVNVEIKKRSLREGNEVDAAAGNGDGNADEEENNKKSKASGNDIEYCIFDMHGGGAGGMAFAGIRVIGDPNWRTPEGEGIASGPGGPLHGRPLGGWQEEHGSLFAYMGTSEQGRAALNALGYVEVAPW